MKNQKNLTLQGNFPSFKVKLLKNIASVYQFFIQTTLLAKDCKIISIVKANQRKTVSKVNNVSKKL